MLFVFLYLLAGLLFYEYVAARHPLRADGVWLMTVLLWPAVLLALLLPGD